MGFQANWLDPKGSKSSNGPIQIIHASNAPLLVGIQPNQQQKHVAAVWLCVCVCFRPRSTHALAMCTERECLALLHAQHCRVAEESVHIPIVLTKSVNFPVLGR